MHSISSFLELHGKLTYFGSVPGTGEGNRISQSRWGDDNGARFEDLLQTIYVTAIS